jgi:hypothetical protein
MDSSAPCANYEARKDWAEKECNMVSISRYIYIYLRIIYILDY